MPAFLARDFRRAASRLARVDELPVALLPSSDCFSAAIRSMTLSRLPPFGSSSSSTVSFRPLGFILRWISSRSAAW